MIGDILEDLVNKVKTVSALGGRVAATLGGTEGDPTLVHIETPAAWAIFQGSLNSDKPAQKWQVMRHNFNVLVFLPYGQGEANFIDTQLKLVEDVAQAVRGTLPLDQGSTLWEFTGVNLIDIEPTRITYQLSFSVEAAYAKQTT